jgi:hypothetical protein
MRIGDRRTRASALEAIPVSAWQDTDGTAPPRWSPVILLGRGETWLGVAPDGSWLIGRRDHLRPLPEGWHVPLLPILESTYEVWNQRLDRVRADNPALAGAVENAVQIDALLAAAINGDGAYWPERALSWLETAADLPLPTAALVSFADSGRNRPQALRQRARALLKRRTNQQPG